MNPYAGSYGFIKASIPDILKEEDINKIERYSKEEFLSFLHNKLKNILSKFEKEEGISKYDFAIEYNYIQNSKRALFLLPPNGRKAISDFIAKIDLENVKAILSAKKINKRVELREDLIYIDGKLVGIACLLDYKNIIEKEYEELIKLFPGNQHEMDKLYFSNLFRSFGSIGNKLALDFVRELVDMHNIISRIKGMEDWIEGGKIGKEHLLNKSIEEIVNNLSSYDLKDALLLYKKDGLVLHFENSLKRQIYHKFLSSYSDPISISAPISFILLSELERDSLREILYKTYGR